MWRSLVAYTSGGRRVAGSNPVIPTNKRGYLQQVSSLLFRVVPEGRRTANYFRIHGEKTDLGKFFRDFYKISFFPERESRKQQRRSSSYFCYHYDYQLPPPPPPKPPPEEPPPDDPLLEGALTMVLWVVEIVSENEWAKLCMV